MGRTKWCRRYWIPSMRIQNVGWFLGWWFDLSSWRWFMWSCRNWSFWMTRMCSSWSALFWWSKIWLRQKLMSTSDLITSPLSCKIYFSCSPVNMFKELAHATKATVLSSYCYVVSVLVSCQWFDIGDNSMFHRRRMDATLKTMEEQQNAKRDEVQCPFISRWAISQPYSCVGSWFMEMNECLSSFEDILDFLCCLYGKFRPR